MDRRGVAAIGAALFLFSASFAAAQHMPTIADCPPGYSLGVADTAEPQLAAKVTDPNAAPPDQKELVTAEQQAPRQFITGCVPPPSQQQQQPTGEIYEDR